MEQKQLRDSQPGKDCPGMTGRDRVEGRRGLLTYSQGGREDLSPTTVSSWVLQTS